MKIVFAARTHTAAGCKRWGTKNLGQAPTRKLHPRLVNLGLLKHIELFRAKDNTSAHSLQARARMLKRCSQIITSAQPISMFCACHKNHKNHRKKKKNFTGFRRTTTTVDGHECTKNNLIICLFDCFYVSVQNIGQMVMVGPTTLKLMNE